MILHALTTALAAALVASPQEGPGPAQGGAAPGASSEDSIHLLSMSCGDLATTLQHPKDAGLARALRMLDERLAEIPSEFEGDVPPMLVAALEPAAIPVWLRLLQAPKSVRVDVSRSAIGSYRLPFQVGFALHEESPEAAQRLEAGVRALAERMRMRLPDGMVAVEDRSILLRTGRTPEPMGGTRAAEMAGDGGGALLAEMRMDLGGYLEFMEALVMQSGAPLEVGIAFDVLDRIGLMDCTLEVATASDASASRTVALVTELGGRMRDAGLLPAEGLAAAHLAPVPADATWMSVERFDMAAAFRALNGLVSELMQQAGGGGDAAEMLASITGFDLEDGLFGALGDTYGVYASHSTGGGGLTSTVLFVSLRDAEALLETKEGIEELLNGQAALHARGYVSARTWTHGDGEYTTLTFPGLPVPMEPTIALTEEWLVVAATPQAALGAMAQIESGDAGIAAHPGIAPLLTGGAKNAITYFDTEHYARRGYGATSLLMSGVSNAMRSRVDATRDPGPLLPTFGVFVEGIRPTIGHGEVHGENYVSVSVGDASNAVQCAAFAGILQDYAPLLALPLLAAGGNEIFDEIGRGF
ncbi:MAG: hypothetical protein AAGB93_21885 [Planctomycetota bacterium]